MSIQVTYNEIVYTIPTTDEVGWGNNLTQYLVALSNGSLTLAGGPFVLLNEVDFGQNYGVKAAYLKSETANSAHTGRVRLGLGDAVTWRNQTNSADLPLSVVNDTLYFNGDPVATNLAGLEFAGPIAYDAPDPPDPLDPHIAQFWIFNSEGLRLTGDIAPQYVYVGDWLAWSTTSLKWVYLPYAAKTILANEVVYNNDSSGLYATNVQDAIDEVVLEYMPKTGGTFTGNVTAPTFIGALTGHASLDLPLGGGTLTGSLTAPTFIGALTGHASLDLPLTGGSLSGLLTASILYDNSSSGITSNRVQGAITELKSDINLLQSNLTYAGNLGYNQPDPPDPVSGSPYYIFETGGLRTVGDIAGTTVSIGDWLIWEATTSVWAYLAYGSKTVIASDVNYSNSASGLTATNVQGAIDEVDAKADTITNYLPKTGGTLTGNLTVNANSPYINLTKKTTGDYAGVQWTLNSVPQWFVYSNASADSSWNLARYDDAGVTAGTALSVNRGTGAVTVAAGIIGTLTGHASLDLPLTGGTLTGNLTLGGSSPTVSLNAAAGEYAFLNYNRSSSRRFSLIMSNEPETGSNAGSNMQLLSYTDTGAYLSSILAINRATGAMTVTQPIIGNLTGHASLDLPLTGGSLTGTLYIAPTSNNPALALREAADSGLGANLYYQNGGLNRWTLNMTAGAETVGDNGADFTIQRFANNSAFLGEVLTITRATGTTVIRAPYLYLQNATDHATIVVTAPAGKNAGFSLSGDGGVPFTDGYDLVNTSGGTTIANYRGAGGFIGNVQGKEVMRLTSAGITGPINGLGQVPVSTAVGTSRPLSAVDFDQGVMPLTAAITITVPSIASMALPSTPGKLRVLAFQITSAGIPTFVAGVGVTINGTTNATVLPLNGAPRRYQFVVLTQMSPDADFWSLS